MKKLLVLGVCACLPFMVGAQSKSKSKREDVVNTMNKIKSSSEIVVAVREDQFPFSYLDSEGNSRGYTVELCESIIKDIRKELEIPRLKVVYVPVKEAELDLMFKRNLIDIDCGNPSIADKNHMLFSNGTIAVEARILTSHTSTAKGLADFNNQVIAVLKGSTLETLLNQYLKSGTYYYRLRSVNSIDEGIQSMMNGNAKAFINDDLVLLSILASDKQLNSSLKITGHPISSRSYGFALANGNESFKKLVDEKLKEKFASGEIHRIYEKWFLMPIPPENINLDFGMSKSTRDLLNEMK